jgi:hypothetical protein
MNIDEVLSTMLNGEPLHDAIVIGIAFTCFFTFYNVLFSSMFSLFRK